MKQVFLGFVVIIGLGLFASFSYSPPEEVADTTAATTPTEGFQWYTWEEAMELNKTTPKKIMIDMYTSWCGWCKVMDRETFTDPEVVAYINKHYYPVKFNAEQKETLEYNGHTFKYIAQGKRGVHEFAYSLLDGKLSYPSIVYLTSKIERITVSPGYKKPLQLMQEMTYIAEEAYTKQTYQQFLKENF